MWGEGGGRYMKRGICAAMQSCAVITVVTSASNKI